MISVKKKNTDDSLYPLISVVIPAYNSEFTINNCLKSVVNQTYKNLEIIVVNDASVDKTVDYVENFMLKYSNIKLISIKKGGLSVARNSGVSVSKGSYITFIDSDDTINKDYVEYLIGLINKFNTEISSCQHKIIKGKNVIDNKINKNAFVMNDHDWLSGTLARNGVDLSAWGKLYKRELFENIRFPAGKLFEDTFTTYKFILKTQRIAIGTASKYNYFINKNSITTSAFTKSKLDLLEATDEMINNVLKIYPDLYPEAQLRISWASVSILNSLILDDKLDKYYNLTENLRYNVLSSRKYILSSINKDIRLSISCLILLMGVKRYKKVLRTYFRKIDCEE